MNQWVSRLDNDQGRQLGGKSETNEGGGGGGALRGPPRQFGTQFATARKRCSCWPVRVLQDTVADA